MKDSLFKAFKDAHSNYPTQDNEGYVPERGAFKSGFIMGAEWGKQEAITDMIKILSEYVKIIGINQETIELLSKINKMRKDP